MMSERRWPLLPTCQAHAAPLELTPRLVLDCTIPARRVLMWEGRRQCVELTKNSILNSETAMEKTKDDHFTKARLKKLWQSLTSADIPNFEKKTQCYLSSNICSPYRVGSANFSQRKIGHAHDNSADSENVAGAPQPNAHAHFIFRFENGPGNQSFFLSTTKIQLKRVNHKLSRRTIRAPWSGRVREASSGPLEKI